MWWRIRPRHTPESVAAELVRGLEDGSIVLPADDALARAVAGAVYKAVLASRREAKSIGETLATVTAAAEHILRRNG